MSSAKTRTSGEQKRPGQEESLELQVRDLEAVDRHGQADNSGDMHSGSCMSRVLSLILRFISYPAPGSLRLRRTSWLDGVRGVAALAVYIFHAMGCWASIVPAWHADDKQSSILQLPVIRTIFVAGGGAVSVFFVLSGYVLTYRCLRLIRTGASHDVYPAVGSSLFRRGFRLYLLPVLLTFCEMLMTRFGFAPPLNFDFVPEPTFLGQLADWLAETNRLVNPLHNFQDAVRGIVAHPKYDAVIWTIPVEYYGSIVCYFLLFALARVTSSTRRMGSVAVLSLISMALGCWNLFCFTAGMLLADFHLGQEEDATTTPTPLPTASPPPPSNPRRPLLWTTIFAASFYLAGFPTLVFPESRTNPMPGFETLRALIPARLPLDDPARFWWSIAGVGLLLAISQLPRLKAVFDSYVCQYLARISFAMYLVHMFCIVLFGLRLQGLLFWVVGLDAAQQMEKGVMYWVVCWVWFVLFTVPVFALAAQVERWVDVPSVKFAKWLEERCLRVYKGLR